MGTSAVADGPAPDTDRSADGRWLALTALTVLFGFQTLRALTPLAVFVLRDRYGWHAAAVGLAMLAVLATGFLVTPVWRAVGPRRFLWVTAGGLGLARLALQAWTGDPLVDLVLAAATTALFFFALPALVARAGPGRLPFVLGWFLGLAADTALHGAYGTWDMIWRSDPATLVAVLVLVGLGWWLLAGAGRHATEDEEWPVKVAPWSPTWTWVALGPLLFLELLVLGNVARLAALTGWGPESAALWVLAGRILAVVAVAVMAPRGRRPGWPAVAVLALALSGSFLVSWPRGILAAVLLLGGQMLAAVLWTLVAGASGGDRVAGRLAVRHGLGLLVFGVLLFLYYGGIDIRLPFAKELLPPIAALGLGAAAVAAAWSAPPRTIAGARFGYSWLALAILPAPLLIQLAAAPNVRAEAADGLPLRIMTYNLHLGIDPRGHLGLERIAATIEAERPDVVALQEVSRGWVLGGSADTLTWLSRRLGMPYVFAPTADPLWGNAVLSRRPILGHQALDLPTEDLLIRRGILSARIGLDEDRPFEVIVTHHHHLRDGGAVRELQSQAILAFWQGRGRTVILGDFNARPADPEIEMLREAGLGDVLALAGVEPGYTNPASEPVQRIDYIWISPDLVSSDVAIPSSAASDHLPVVATLDSR